MTPRTTVRAGSGAATRTRIEREARRLFAERGVAGTSVRDIAQAAGTAEGTLYRHFPSKEALAQSLFETGYAALAADIAAIAAAEPGIEGRLRRLVERFCRLFDEDRESFAFLMLNQHDHLREIAATSEANVVHVLSRIFGEAIDGSELPRQDATLATAIALGAVVQPAVFHLYGRLTGPLAARAPAISAAVLAALGGAVGGGPAVGG